MRKPLLAALALMLIPMGQAQLVEALPYESSTDFSGSLEGLPALVSGAMTYNASDARNATILFGSDQITITGLTMVCWQDDEGNPHCESRDGLSIQIRNDSSFVFRTPGAFDVAMDAAHSLTFFVDAGQMFGNNEDGSPRDEDIPLGPSLVSIPTDEGIHVTDVDTIPKPTTSSFTSFNAARNQLALVLAMSDTSAFVIKDGDATVDTVSAAGAWVGFSGEPQFSVIRADMAVLPMPDGALASFAPASDDAAQRGLSPENLATAFGSLQESDSEQEEDAAADISNTTSALAAFLNGAYIDVGQLLTPGEGPSPGGDGTEASQQELIQSITLVRFESMDASRSDDAVAYEGAAPLQIQEGEVAGAKDLRGGLIPLTGIILWLVATGALIARILLHPSRNNKLWDNLHWIGRIAGPLAVVVVFIIWDSAMARLWGVSLLTSGASGASLGAIAVLQLIPLMLAGIYFGLPTRILMASVTRFAGQGRMMNIGGVIAPFVTLLFGIPLLLSLIQSALNLAGGGAGP